jgi:hypothetical protein
MIDPKPADIGRKIAYRDRTGGKVEEGVITSFNDTCVFVRYARTRGRGRLGGRTWTGLRLVPIRRQASSATKSVPLH